MIFGKKIKELREEHGLLQRHLCAALEIDTPMYSKIERGERKAKRSQIPIMAKLFEVDEKKTADYLVGRQDFGCGCRRRRSNE